MNGRQKIRSGAKAFNHETARGTKLALWWLRHFESIAPFWKGFSWIWVIGVVFYAVVGYLNLGHALLLILVIGVVTNTGIYLAIRAMSSHLKHLEDGPVKEEAHKLMIKIIKRRVPHRA